MCPMFQEPHGADHGDDLADENHGDDDGETHSEQSQDPANVTNVRISRDLYTTLLIVFTT